MYASHSVSVSVSLFTGVDARSAVGILGCWQSCLCSVFDQACETHKFSRSLSLSASVDGHTRALISSAWVSEDSAVYTLCISFFMHQKVDINKPRREPSSQTSTPGSHQHIPNPLLLSFFSSRSIAWVCNIRCSQFPLLESFCFCALSSRAGSSVHIALPLPCESHCSTMWWSVASVRERGQLRPVPGGWMTLTLWA